MARRDREAALRIRLVPDTDAVVGRGGVHFLRGRESFFLDDRGARKLADLYAELARIRDDLGVSVDDAIRLLSADELPAAPTS